MGCLKGALIGGDSFTGKSGVVHQSYNPGCREHMPISRCNVGLRGQIDAICENNSLHHEEKLFLFGHNKY